MPRRMKKPTPDTPETIKRKADKASVKAAAVAAGNPPIGRPTKFSMALALRICEEISDATPLDMVCQASEMPDRSTVYRWLREHASFRDEYARARRTRADARMDRIDDIVSRVESGDLKPDVARVMLDAIKWQMSKEQPGSYGDKVAMEHTGKDGGPIETASRPQPTGSDHLADLTSRYASKVPTATVSTPGPAKAGKSGAGLH